jgi:hypothetical protein
MSTMTATRPKSAYFGIDMEGAMTFTGQPLLPQTDGTYRVVGKSIFRAGTFRDSAGEQTTWTIQHLEQMAANFKLLRDKGIFPNVPARKDHSFSIEKVIGYIDEMYVQGDQLLVDFSVASSQDATNLMRGKYRSVSNEVGMYVDNNETPYWPVVMGFAYVDMPAVEGLHSKSEMPVTYFSRNAEQENKNVTTDNDKGVQRASSFRIKGNDTQDHAAVQAYITELEARPGPATFRVRGAETTDVAAVQTHIDALEGFAKETKDGGRKAFVSGLAQAGKIAEPMVESLSALAVSMDDAQFDAFKTSYEAAPAMRLLQEHGQSTNTDGKSPAGGGGDAASEKLILEEQIRMHRDAGMTEDELKNTKAFKRHAQITNQA